MLRNAPQGLVAQERQIDSNRPALIATSRTPQHEIDSAPLVHDEAGNVLKDRYGAGPLATERQAIPVMRCVCGHPHSEHDMLSSTSCRADHCGCPRWGLDDMHLHRAPLIALFDAARAVKPWSLTLTEERNPGAGPALVAWARSHKLRISEQHFFVEHCAPYANLKVKLGGDECADITVLNYRALTPDEITIAEANATIRERTERVGTREVVL